MSDDSRFCTTTVLLIICVFLTQYPTHKLYWVKIEYILAKFA